MGLRRTLYAEPAAAGGAARRRGVRRLPARPLQSIGRTGRRADRELPLELLRALRAGQLAGRAEPDRQLRPALGIRPAVRRRERRHRQHRLRLGEHARAGVRAHRRRAIRTRAIRRSGSRPTCSTCATGASAAAPIAATTTTSRRGSASPGRSTPKTVVRTGGGIYYVRDIGNAVFDTVRNAPFTIRRDEPAETFRPNLSLRAAVRAHGRADVHPRGSMGRAVDLRRAVVARRAARAVGAA